MLELRVHSKSSPMYKIQTFAEQVGVSAETLRYYEKLGLLRPARNAGGQRVYSDADAAWVAFLLRLKATDMPLEQIAKYSQLRHAGDSTLRERYALLLAHSDRLAEKQRALAEHQAHLGNKLRIYQQMLNQQPAQKRAKNGGRKK